MRRREPLDIDRTWQHSVPVPMPNRPVCVTEEEAIAIQLELEDEQLQEWKEKVAAIRKKEEGKKSK